MLGVLGLNDCIGPAVARSYELDPIQFLIRVADALGPIEARSNSISLRIKCIQPCLLLLPFKLIVLYILLFLLVLVSLEDLDLFTFPIVL